MDLTTRHCCSLCPLSMFVAVLWVPITAMVVVCTLFVWTFVSAWPCLLIGGQTHYDNGGHVVCSQGVGRGYKFKPSDITGGCLALT